MEVEFYLRELQTLGFEVGFLVGWVHHLVEQAEGQTGAVPPDTETFRNEIEQGRKHGVVQAARELDGDLVSREALVEAIQSAISLVSSAANLIGRHFTVQT